MRKRYTLVCGVGINDADYPVRVKTAEGYKQCPFYTTWKSMLSRCYLQGRKGKYPTYDDCYVSKEWHRFSNFRAWMETQDWEGKALDKDIKVRGNREYSPDKCCFVDRLVNSFVGSEENIKGNLMKGITGRTSAGRYIVKCVDPLGRFTSYLGVFNTEEDGNRAYLLKKQEYSKDLALTVGDESIAEALRKRFELPA